MWGCGRTGGPSRSARSLAYCCFGLRLSPRCGCQTRRSWHPRSHATTARPLAINQETRRRSHHAQSSPHMAGAPPWLPGTAYRPHTGLHPSPRLRGRRRHRRARPALYHPQSRARRHRKTLAWNTRRSRSSAKTLPYTDHSLTSFMLAVLPIAAAQVVRCEDTTWARDSGCSGVVAVRCQSKRKRHAAPGIAETRYQPGKQIADVGSAGRNDAVQRQRDRWSASGRPRVRRDGSGASADLDRCITATRAMAVKPGRWLGANTRKVRRVR